MRPVGPPCARGGGGGGGWFASQARPPCARVVVRQSGEAGQAIMCIVRILVSPIFFLLLLEEYDITGALPLQVP